mgnify:FL=1|nr:MAG TPA: hypothetical protein [Caudoviricetes sp.]
MNKINFYDIYQDMQNDPFIYIIGFVVFLGIIFGWGFICFICPPILVVTILIIAITIFVWKLIKRLAEIQEDED